MKRIDIWYKQIWLAILTTTKGTDVSYEAFSTEEGAMEYKKEQEKNKGCLVVLKSVELNCRK